jgi:phosphopantothenoylcysteine synthetase/decarboxylase
MNILITAGGTEEKIDQVRRITNTSTGQTGLFLAHQLQAHGHEIFYVRAKKAEKFVRANREIVFESADELENAIQQILNAHHIDIVIQCAAISDFRVDKIVLNGELFEPENLKKISSRDSVEIVLKARKKIITQIKNMSSNSMPIVIGFKLTNTDDPLERKEAVLRLSNHPDINFIIHNDLTEITDVQHPTKIYFKDKVLFEGQTKSDLANNILLLIQNLKGAYSYDLMS